MKETWPQIHRLGVNGFLIRFADTLSERSNRAAIAFRSALRKAKLMGVEEISATLASVYLRFDFKETSPNDIEIEIKRLLDQKNWFDAKLPDGRKYFEVPTLYHQESGSQLEEVAKHAGLTIPDAIQYLESQILRVQTIGFAPGMPYIGELDERWNIPRQTDLTPKVPAGALCLAVRQMVLFPVASQTGWRQIGQTHFPLFELTDSAPFTLRTGDELRFKSVNETSFKNLADAPLGGAKFELIS